MRRSELIGSLLLAVGVLAGCPSEPEPAPDPTPAPPAGRIAPDVALTLVTVNQGVAVPVVSEGARVPTADRNAQVIVGRPGILRVFVTPDDGFEARDLVAELVLEERGEAQVRRETLRIDAPSLSSDLDSTFVFPLSAEDVTADTHFSVAIREVDGAAPTTRPGNWPTFPAFDVEVAPADHLDEAYDIDTAWLGATDWGGVVRVHIVPVRYETDGSGRLPDTSPEQLELLRSWMLRLYPVRDVQFEVGEEYATELPFDSTSEPMGDLLEELIALRTERGIPFDTYIYAMVNPAESRDIYCAQGCTAGIAYRVGNPNTSRLRCGVGLGYTETNTAETMAHEVGHNHDRGHADCGGAGNTDPDYPYPNARTGVWGWDIVDGGLIDPAQHADVMGYCQPRWISDYQYDALWRRAAAVEGLAEWSGTAAADYQLVAVRPGGRSAIKGVVTLDAPPGDAPVSVELLGQGGDSRGKVDGHLVPMADAEPGVASLFVPPLPEDVAALRLPDGRVVSR